MKAKNIDTTKKQGHSHMKHMWMMAVCCGLPILGFLAIGVIGIAMPSLETVLLLVCPIGMGAMMYMMHRDNKNSCCQSEESKDDTTKTRKEGSIEA